MKKVENARKIHSTFILQDQYDFSAMDDILVFGKILNIFLFEHRTFVWHLGYTENM